MTRNHVLRLTILVAIMMAASDGVLQPMRHLVFAGVIALVVLFGVIGGPVS